MSNFKSSFYKEGAPEASEMAHLLQAFATKPQEILGAVPGIHTLKGEK